MFVETLNQQLALIDVLNYQTINNATVYSMKAVDMSVVKRFQYVVGLAQTTAGTGTLALNLIGSANSNMTGNTNITGTNTNLTANNTVARIEIRSDQLTQANSGYRYIKLQAIGATNAVTAFGIGQGGEAEQRPAGANYNLNTTFLVADTTCTL